jgi:hypothetical protein
VTCCCARLKLPTIGFALTKHPRDFRVFVVKNLTQKEDGSLDGSQPLQKQQECHRKRFVDSSGGERIASWHGQQGFGQPLPKVLLALELARTADD